MDDRERLEPMALSVAQAAQLTTLSERTIRQAIADGRIRALKVGARRLITRAALAEFLGEPTPAR